MSSTASSATAGHWPEDAISTGSPPSRSIRIPAWRTTGRVRCREARRGGSTPWRLARATRRPACRGRRRTSVPSRLEDLCTHCNQSALSSGGALHHSSTAAVKFGEGPGQQTAFKQYGRIHLSLFSCLRLLFISPCLVKDSS
eukprot:scaffold40421_cov61-Phaeocystis_antarctica.AAC.6